MVAHQDEGWLRERERRHENALKYYQYLASLDGLDERAWLDQLGTAQALNDVPAAYALINRQVAPLSDARWKFQLGDRYFPSHRQPSVARCESIRVWGYLCPIHTPATNLEIDHSWPYSLGGRSVPSNGVWLCKVHNRVKSADVHNYDWPLDEWPSWLMTMLANIKRDCELAILNLASR